MRDAVFQALGAVHFRISSWMPFIAVFGGHDLVAKHLLQDGTVVDHKFLALDLLSNCSENLLSIDSKLGFLYGLKASVFVCSPLLRRSPPVTLYCSSDLGTHRC